jgi:hypothetical protein
MEQFWITLLIIAAGGAGYLMVTFWVRPILRYRDIKYEVFADLVFFANALDLQRLDGTLREDTLQRKEKNRRHAAQLAAIYSDLPYWYKCWLRKKKEDPQEASKELVGLSNSSTWRDAEGFIKGVKEHLRLRLRLPQK